MSINVFKLHEELVAAGIPIDGCDGEGRVHFKPSATIEQRNFASSVVRRHDPALTQSQRLSEIILSEHIVSALAFRLSASYGGASQVKKDWANNIISSLGRDVVTALNGI